MTGPTWVETFHDLHRASTVGELWAVLCSWHGIRSSTQWEEPYILFRRFHAADSEDALVTAALLCTDHRWRKGSHHLIVRIVESGGLSGTDELQLAEWFIAVEGLEVEVGAVEYEHGAGGELEVVTVQRPVWPPLRRWAAARLVAADPSRWRGLLETAERMPSRDAAALVAGVMDAAEYIPRDERRVAVAEGLASGSGVVRLAALPALAALEGADAARARAAADQSATVRSWTPKASPARDPAPRSTSADEADGQDALF